MLINSKSSVYLKKQKNFYFLVDNQKTHVNIIRIQNLTSYYLNFIYNKELFFNEGFFVHEQTIFLSLFFKMELDLIFVNKDGIIIKILKSFQANKISDYFSETKFLYVFPKNTIDSLKINSNSIIGHKINKKRKEISFKKID